MKTFALVLLLAAAVPSLLNQSPIAIAEIVIDRGSDKQFGPTNIDAGPCTGSILNAHYFPGLNAYLGGNWKLAAGQMNYFLARPQYTKMNPRQAEFFTTGHYIRGMVVLYHSSGVQRLNFAAKDFLEALRWNPRNFAAQLELSRVYGQSGMKEKAITALEQLIQMGPDDKTLEMAKRDLKVLKTPGMPPGGR
jgi:tetratricopeptide (TPR) repeat protein